MTRTPEFRRAALLAFMASRGLRPAPFAKKADVGASTVRMFLNGTNDSLSQAILEKLAAAHHATVAELIGEAPIQPYAGEPLADPAAPQLSGDSGPASADDFHEVIDLIARSIAKKWYRVARTAAERLVQMIDHEMQNEGLSDPPRSEHLHREPPRSPRDA